MAGTLGPVYGVRLHEDFTRWTDFMDAISLDLIGLTYPGACIGSMGDRLLLAGLWPFAAMILGGAALACYAFAEWHRSGRADSLRRDLVRATLRRLLYWAILVAYLALPSVSRSIFKAKQCESFNIDDVKGRRGRRRRRRRRGGGGAREGLVNGANEGVAVCVSPARGEGELALRKPACQKAPPSRNLME